MSFDVAGPTEIDRGYMELRVNWSTTDLMDMTGEQLDRLKRFITGLEGLQEELSQEEERADL